MKELYGDDAHDGGDLLPSQYVDMLRSEINSADRKLRLAVLVDAIECLQGRVRNAQINYRRRRFAAQDAYHWIVEATPAEHRFTLSFEDCCAGCGIDAGKLRESLKQWWHTPASQRPAIRLTHLMPVMQNQQRRVRDYGRRRQSAHRRDSQWQMRITTNW